MESEIRQGAPVHDEIDVRGRRGLGAQGLESGERRSIGRRPLRALFRFIVAVLIGVGVTLAWQSYGREGVKVARSYAPSLSWLLPAPTKEMPSDNHQISAVAIATAVKQQLEPVARKVDVMQHSIVQLAAKIDELAANQVTQNMQAVGRNINQKTPSPRAGTNATQAPEPGTGLDKPDAAASVGAAPAAGNAAEAKHPPSNRCDQDACKKAYFTFNPADCTYQPLEGPRRLCTK